MRAIDSAAGGLAHRHGVEHLPLSRRRAGPAAGSGPRGDRQRCSPARADQLEHLVAPGHQRGGPVRISWCTPSDGRLVTGPGTPISGRFRRPAQLAVLSAPLRTAASTTTVPRVSAAISRLRVRNRIRVGAPPGRQLGDDGAGLGEVVEQVAVGGRVGAVDAAGQHRDRRPARGERAPVGGLVDAEGRPGDHGDARAGDRGRRSRAATAVP